MTLSRRLAAEALGTAFLLAVIVGSGIMGERLAGGKCRGRAARQQYRHRLRAVGAHHDIRADFWRTFQSGRHAGYGERRPFPWRHVLPYVVVQVAAALLGVALAHVMFSLPLFTASEHVRSRTGQWVSEAVATAGLLLTIGLGAARERGAVGGLVAAYITAAYWFTASTSLRQSGRDACARGHQYVRRNSPRRCGGFHRRAATARLPRTCCEWFYRVERNAGSVGPESRFFLSRRAGGINFSGAIEAPQGCSPDRISAVRVIARRPLG